MRCFRCGKDTTSDTFRNALIDTCNFCGGIWLDAGELRTVMSWRKGDAEKNFYGDRLIEEYIERVVDISAKGLCPRCGEPSLKVIDVDGVEIDKCRICSGMFFDKGELSDILRNNSSFRKWLFRLRRRLRKMFSAIRGIF